MICQRSPAGESAARRTRSRTSSTPMESFSVRTMRTSAWLPAITVWHALQWPQPVSVSHCSAAAKATAALDRPEPGGPVNSQAWVIPSPLGCALKAGDHRALADEVFPHRAGLLGLGHDSNSSTRLRMSAAISSTGARASSTR